MRIRFGEIYEFARRFRRVVVRSDVDHFGDRCFRRIVDLVAFYSFFCAIFVHCELSVDLGFCVFS